MNEHPYAVFKTDKLSTKTIPLLVNMFSSKITWNCKHAYPITNKYMATSSKGDKHLLYASHKHVLDSTEKIRNTLVSCGNLQRTYTDNRVMSHMESTWWIHLQTHGL